MLAVNIYSYSGKKKGLKQCEKKGKRKKILQWAGYARKLSGRKAAATEEKNG